MYLAENIDDGYESSLAKSSISQNSKKSETSNSITETLPSTFGQNWKIVIQEAKEEAIDQMFGTIWNYFETNQFLLPKEFTNTCSIIPESSFGSDSMMSNDMQVADEDIRVEEDVGSSLKDSKMFVPGNLINKSAVRSEVMKNLQAVRQPRMITNATPDAPSEEKS